VAAPYTAIPLDTVHTLTAIALGDKRLQMTLLRVLNQLFTSKANALLAFFTDTLKKFRSRKVLKHVRISLRGNDLYLKYVQLRDGQIRLFIGMGDAEGTGYEEFGREVLIQIRDALRRFLKSEQCAAQAIADDARKEEIKIFLDLGYIRIKRDISEDRGTRLFILFSSESMFREMSSASAAIIADELDAFLALQLSPALLESR